MDKLNVELIDTRKEHDDAKAWVDQLKAKLGVVKETKRMANKELAKKRLSWPRRKGIPSGSPKAQKTS